MTEYLYGLDLLGHTQDSVTTYYGYDAQNLRLHLDGSGEIAAQYRYGPFGEIVGDSPDGYGYSGEQWHGEVGLLYLRARYYRPEAGRFISRDPQDGDFRHSQTLNRYLYVVASPVSHSDPSGLAAPEGAGAGGEIDYRNLTGWLYRALIENAKDPAIRRLKTSNVGSAAMACVFGPFGPVAWTIPAASHAIALYQYSQLVKNGARWDVKDEIGIKLGPGITLCSFGRCVNDIEYSVPGNVHFAYLGMAAGFLGGEIQAGAAYAQRTDPYHDPNSSEWQGQPYNGVFDWGATWYDPGTINFGDEATDHEAVTLGIVLWRKYGGDMTRAEFEGELGNWFGKLAREAPLKEPVAQGYAAHYRYPDGYPTNYFDNIGRVYRESEEQR